MKYNYSIEDIDFLKTHYPNGEWDIILSRFPMLTKTAIYRKMQKVGIKSNNTHRANFDISKTRKRWSKEESDIVYKYYSNLPINEVMELLPNRSKNSIINFTKSKNIISYGSMHNKWNSTQINYLINNWELLPDKIIADNIGKTFRAVKAKREELGFYRQDMTSNSYPTLSKYLRGQNQKWKKDSMKSCNYKCIITGSKNFDIHHLYGLSNIINDIMNRYPQYKDKNFSDYSDEDLSFLFLKFTQEQTKYPLGVCIDKKLHILFHSMYGQYYNTPEQWYQFVKDYTNGIYNKYA